MTLPSPEILVLTLLFSGIGYVQNEYLQPKHAIAYKSDLSMGNTDTFRVYKYPKKNSYFCPPYCAVNHLHFVHLKDKCTHEVCNHMVINKVVRYMNREEYTKGNDSRRGSANSPPIRIKAEPGDRNL